MTPPLPSSDPAERQEVAAGLVPDASNRAIAAYGELRTRVGALVADLDPERARTTVVPACPAWTVTDALAHLVGVTIDIVDGNIAEAGTAPWADAQVERFSPLGIDGLLARWDETASVIDTLGGFIPDLTASQMVFDAVSHEHDIRAAIGEPGGRDSSAVDVGFGFVLHILAGRIDAGQAPPLMLRLDDAAIDVRVGGPAPAVSVTAPKWELMRAFGGRRSADQVRTLAWDGDAEPYLALLHAGPLSPPAAPLVE